MTTWIAFLRAINVGGNNLIKMSDLRDLLTGLGLEEVKTHLQSGNAVFNARSKDRTKLSQEISAAIHAAHGQRPDIILRTPDELRRALDRVPFDPSANPSLVLINFLAAPADPEGAKQLAAYEGPETVVVHGSEVYIHYPEGMGRSKLNRVPMEKMLGTRGTGRNLNTVRKMLEMVELFPP
ncbi:MAG: DUF1697 domain-containing protein [Thermoanaerobaculia bacterium]